LIQKREIENGTEERGRERAVQKREGMIEEKERFYRETCPRELRTK
jgi:hypothetical protein